MNNTSILNEQTLFVKPIKIGKQLMIKVVIEDIHTKTSTEAMALIDSGYMRTCIDEEFTRKAGLMLIKVKNLIKVEYADRTSVEDSAIQYSMDIRIKAVGAVVVIGALVMRFKSTKVFLEFN
jgi:hypothetical protein